MTEKTITPGKVLLSLALCLMLLSAGSLFTACKNEPKQEDTKEVAEDQNEEKFEANDAKEDDSEFLVAAAETDLMEIEIGKLAKSKSTNANVKKFADMLIAEHTKASNDLKPFAEKQNVSLPLALTEKGKEKYDKLNEKTGKDFDQKFADMMVEGHEDAVKKMEKAAENANDPDIKIWAANLVPILRTHLEHAKTLKEQVK